ncbi:hypothetical protein FRB94_003611 [Tulasnella sp. JGI-2019a]|nr:hypothetical protein FRB94_003611 [Tulasnella sp. JGI-2019a]KAG9008918.1 hypothetical protein FRB93_005968 [Tulasnella sp. JGI-2019a]
MLLDILISAGQLADFLLCAVSYLFRTTGQVIGVSLSGALLQSLLVKHLRERITGPGAAEIIQNIRHSITIIPNLDPATRRAAVESWGLSLRIVYLAQMSVAILTFISCLFIEENPLPGTMAEQEEQEDRRRQERQRNHVGSDI